MCIPIEKIRKAIDLINNLLSKKTRKAKVLEIQKLCGYLNFLCRCIVPGRVFLRHLYVSVSSDKLKQHHHVNITEENRLDLLVWRAFLTQPESVSRPFMDANVFTALDIDMFSDASRNFKLGFGVYCGSEWTYGQWNREFMEQNEPSIEYLELYGVTVAVMNWIKFFKNKEVALFCDNEAVVHMINNTASKCKNCMVLLRLITLKGLMHNVRIFAKYVNTKDNGKADALSRLDFKCFRRLGPTMNDLPSNIPKDIWPLWKIWI